MRWTTEDFDALDWHDAHVNALRIEDLEGLQIKAVEFERALRTRIDHSGKIRTMLAGRLNRYCRRTTLLWALMDSGRSRGALLRGQNLMMRSLKARLFRGFHGSTLVKPPPTAATA